MTEMPTELLTALLFSMIGPIGLMPSFAAATAEASRGLVWKIAALAILIAFVGFALAVFAGVGMMDRWGASKPSLIVAAGVILGLTSLRNIFGWGPAPGPPRSATLATALSPVAVPGIVTPVGVAIAIIFASHYPDTSNRLALLTTVGGVLAFDFVAMLGADLFMRRIGAAPLVLLGAVFGVLQAAVGVELILSGLKRAGVLG